MTGALVAAAWEKITALSRYGTAPGTLAWFEGHRYVHWWDFRKNVEGWRDLGPHPYFKATPHEDIFSSRALLAALRRRA